MEKNLLRRPKRVLLLPGCLAAFGIGLLFFNRFALSLIGGAFLLSALVLVYRWCRCVILYDNSEYVTVNFFGKHIPHRYADLWGIEKGRRLYLEKGSIRIYPTAPYADFLELANRRYQSANGKRIPKVHSIPRSFDPFCGSVLEPMQYVVVFLILILFGAAGLIVSILWLEPAAIAVSSGILAFFVLFFVLLVYVGRHADTLPRWIVHIFFKENALTFRK